ncbi:putative fatty-acid-CoA ligase FadD9 (fatty-acid-CoA synthetase) (fatty-acid-CoA synthase) [Planoprotostelium fungivorum]|uniref:Putative fatty-acid-CoA ligase FadD9 (Fatty-acid-CoA synthetase) (Fatty-acid-CoA synthase) n=1 Tax=Planoprotostelium fungivorum TaxID=1890364 RepID=A0A2P6NCX7_9EUKA|nr:putative fatty-acid-CoA ligase FadD9 (fatty-acid-CoA synthetase) (fatty-acid-CoA synthase) [Planoprotostelium fungivorum]
MDADSVSDWKSLATHHFLAADWTTALECFDRALTNEPSSVTLLTNKSATLLKLERYIDAFETAMIARSMDARDIKAHIFATRALTAMNRFKEARDLLDSCTPKSGEEELWSRSFRAADDRYLENYYKDTTSLWGIKVKGISRERGKGTDGSCIESYKYGDTIFEEEPIMCHPFMKGEVALDVSNGKAGILNFISDSLRHLRSEDMGPYEPYRVIIDGGTAVSNYVYCDHCELEKYCCSSCKEKAWEEYHNIMCPRKKGDLSSHYNRLISLSKSLGRTNMMLVARMFARCITHTKLPGKGEGYFSELFENYACNEEPAEGDEKARDIFLEMIKESPMKKNVTIERWRSFNGMIHRNAQTILPVSKFHRFVETANPTLQGEITGGRDFITFLEEESDILEKLLPLGGSAMCRLANSMNHSCQPNSVVASCFPDFRIKLIALDDIQPDQELTFSYIDENLPLRERRKQLQDGYRFTCQCPKCTAGRNSHVSCEHTRAMLDREKTSDRETQATRYVLLDGQLQKSLLDLESARAAADETQMRVLQNRINILENKLKEITVTKEVVQMFLDSSGYLPVIRFCNQCIQTIREDRDSYHCTEESDYDLCDDCHQKGHTHPTYKNDPLSLFNKRKMRNTGSLGAAMSFAFRVYAPRPALGHRLTIEGRLQRDFHWYNYEEIGRLAFEFGSGLCGRFELVKGDFVAISGHNSILWTVCDTACIMRGFVIVPLDLRMDDEDTAYVLRNSGVKLVVVDGPALQAKMNRVCTLYLELKGIVSFDSLSTRKGPLYTPTDTDVDVSDRSTTFDGMVTLGRRQPFQLPDPQAFRKEDIISIVYTSGSTGAVMTNRIWAVNFDVIDLVDPYVIISKDPMAHISDREDVLDGLLSGARVGVRSEDQSLIYEDISLLNPSRISSTPRFYNVIHAEFLADLSENMIQASQEKKAALTEEETSLVIERVRGIFGHRIQDISGVMNFLKEVWGMKVEEGYGTTGMISFYCDTETHSITEVGSIYSRHGKLNHLVRYKLVDAPELGYTQEDKPFPRGELYVKTEGTISHYHNNEEETSKNFDEEGFFRTGDIVALIGDRQIKIVDRKKNLFKLSQGVYIAPEKLEGIFLSCPVVDQVMITCADVTKFPEQNAPIAIVVPNPRILSTVCQNLPRNFDGNLKELCASEEVRKMVREELREKGTKGGLKSYELPWWVLLDDEPFTIDNKRMTVSNKLNRAAIERHYAPIIVDHMNRLTEEKKEKTACDIMRDVLGVNDGQLIGQTFLSCGGDSLSAIRLTSLLKRELNVDVPIEVLYRDDVSLDQIIELSSSSVENEEEKMKKDTILPEDIIPQWDRECDRSDGASVGIFLTGATGFLGIHLLIRLMMNLRESQNRYVIHCLVRGSSDEECRKRLSDEFKRVQILSETPIELQSPSVTVEVLPGDLSLPFLGLSETKFREISRTTDVIVHCGAFVNHVLPYSSHLSNVTGTNWALRLCSMGRRKAFVHISSLSVISSGTKEREVTPYHRDISHSGGYTQSKWYVSISHTSLIYNEGVRETRLGSPGKRTTGQRDTTRIYQLGHSKWFVFTRLMWGCHFLGSFPRCSSTGSLNLVPVDYVSEVVSKVTLRAIERGEGGEHLHLLNNRQTLWRDVIRWSCEERENVMPVEKWKSYIHSSLEASDATHRQILSGLLMFPDGLPKDEDSEYYAKEESREKVRSLGVECPEITLESTKIFMKYLQIVKVDENGLVLARHGQTHTVSIPISFSQLRDTASRTFDLSEELEFYTIESTPITQDDFPKISSGQISVVFVLTASEQGRIVGDTRLMVNITPSKNILLKGGTAEYDVASAIAEIVDNSIQAVKDNASGNKLIQIRVKEEANGMAIYVWDNGKGMKADQLRKWATMGESQCDDPSVQESRGKANTDVGDRGFISRFGVGAKKAGFYLGKKITVSTKTNGGKWVNMISLSQKSLNKHGEEWQATMKIRPQGEKEGKFASWTLVKIVDLNILPFFAFYDDAVTKLRERLASIYYYYTRGSIDKPNDLYTIHVNGKSVTHGGVGMEAKYETMGKQLFVKEFAVEVDDKKKSLVRLKLYYYPFDGAAETLPCPPGVEKNAPLIMRKPGVNVYWNDRQISDAHLALLEDIGITEGLGTADGVKLQANWFQRVHGSIFLNSEFPVTHNKMHIVPDHSAFQALKSHRDSAKKKEFRKWLLQCHLTLDQEIVYEGEKYNKVDDKTYCDAFTKGGNRIKVNDYVSIKLQKILHAKIESIYYRGRSEDKQSEGMGSFIVHSIKSGTAQPEQILLSKIKSKVSPEEYKKYDKEQRNRLPGLIKFYEGDNALYPPTRLTNGEKLKWVSCAVYDHNEKLLDSTIIKDLSLQVTFKVLYKDTVLYTVSSESCYKPALYSFKDINCFDRAGNYQIQFSASWEGMKKEEELRVAKHDIQVGAGEPVSLEWMSGELEENVFVPLDSPIPDIEIAQKDVKENTVAFKKTPIITIKCVTRKGNKINVTDAHVKLEKGNIIVSKIEINEKKLGHAEMEAFLYIEVEGLRECEIPLIVLPGAPYQIEFKSDAFGKMMEKDSLNFRIDSPSPEITLRTLDKYGNPIIRPRDKTFINIQFKNVGRKDYKLEIKDTEDGYVTLKADTLKMRERDENTPCSVEFSVENTDQVLEVTVEKSITIDKPRVNLTLKMIEEDGEVIQSEDLKYGKKNEGAPPIFQVPVGDTTSRFTLLLSETDLEKNEQPVSGTIECSWSEKKMEIENTPLANVDLPPLELSTRAKQASFTVSYTSSDSKKKISSKFKVQYVPGHPKGLTVIPTVGQSFDRLRCGKELPLEIGYIDEYNNPIPQSRLEEVERTVVVPQDYEISCENPAFKIISQSIELSTPEPLSQKKSQKESHPMRATIAIAGLGPCELTLHHKKGIYNDAKFKVTVQEGSAACLLIDKVPLYRMEIEQGEKMQEVVITCCDAYHNPCRKTAIELKIDCDQDLPFATPKKMDTKDGRFKLGGMKVTGTPGEYQVHFKSVAVELQKCTIHLVVKGNQNIPQNIVLANPEVLSDIKTTNAELPPIHFLIYNTMNNIMKDVQPSEFFVKWQESKYSCTQSKEHLVVSNLPGCNRAGIYNIQASYKEVSVVDAITVSPGESTAIEIPKWSSSLVSAGQNLAVGLQVNVVDAHGNSVGKGDYELVLTMESESGSNPPILMLDNKPSPISVQMREGSATLNCLSLGAQRATSGEYFVRFHVRGTKLKDYKASFFFNDDEQDREYKQELQQRCSTLYSQINQKKREFTAKQSEGKQFENTVRQEKQRHATLANEIAAKWSHRPNDFEQGHHSEPTVQRWLDHSQRSLHQFMENRGNTPQSRPPQVPTNSIVDEMRNRLASEGQRQSGIIGIVSDLAYVDDERESILYAKMCGPKVQAILLDTNEQFKKYYNMYRNASSAASFLSMQNVLAYSGDRGRSSQGGNSDLIPLQPAAGAPTDGFVGYAVNRIQLKPQHEFLRKTVFWNLLKETMVFRTLDQAQKYRSWVSSRGQRCPTLLAVEEGEVVDAQGFVTIGKKQRSRDAFSFGSMSVTDQPEYSLYKQSIDMCNALLASIKKINQAEKEAGPRAQQNVEVMRALQRDIDTSSEELRELELELKQTSTPSSQRGKRSQEEELESTQRQKKRRN